MSRDYIVVVRKSGKARIFKSRDITRIISKIRAAYLNRPKGCNLDYHKYSTEQDAFIKSNYRTHSASEIARRLSTKNIRITKNMVISRAGRLGLRRRKNDTTL